MMKYCDLTKQFISICFIWDEEKEVKKKSISLMTQAATFKLNIHQSHNR